MSILQWRSDFQWALIIPTKGSMNFKKLYSYTVFVYSVMLALMTTMTIYKWSERSCPESKVPFLFRFLCFLGSGRFAINFSASLRRTLPAMAGTYINVVWQWCHNAGQEIVIMFLSPMVEFWISWFIIFWFGIVLLKEMAPSQGPINQDPASCGRIDQQWSTQNNHQIVEALIKNFQVQCWNEHLPRCQFWPTDRWIQMVVLLGGLVGCHTCGFLPNKGLITLHQS